MQQPPREHFLFANGLRHHLLEWGDPGSPHVVFLCHGFLDLAWGFAQLAPGLADAGYRVLAADFRGHGESGHTPPGSYYYFPDYVLDLHALTAQLSLGRFHLLGHSMGGTVSSYFAATHPDALITLTLLEGLGPRGEAPSEAPRRMERWLASVDGARDGHARLRDLDDAMARLSARHRSVAPDFLRLLAEKSTRAHPDGDGLTWRFDPLHRTPSPIAFDPARYLHHLARIEAPTLLLDGERGLRNHDEAARTASLKQQARATIAGAGHMLHWTHCDEVLKLVSAHLLAHDSRAP